MKTRLIIEMRNALKNMRELHDLFESISKMNLQNLGGAFQQIANNAGQNKIAKTNEELVQSVKAVEAATKRVNEAVKVQKELHEQLGKIQKQNAAHEEAIQRNAANKANLRLKQEQQNLRQQRQEYDKTKAAIESYQKQYMKDFSGGKSNFATIQKELHNAINTMRKNIANAKTPQQVADFQRQKDKLHYESIGARLAHQQLNYDQTKKQHYQWEKEKKAIEKAQAQEIAKIATRNAPKELPKVTKEVPKKTNASQDAIHKQDVANQKEVFDFFNKTRDFNKARQLATDSMEKLLSGMNASQIKQMADLNSFSGVKNNKDLKAMRREAAEAMTKFRYPDLDSMWNVRKGLTTNVDSLSVSAAQSGFTFNPYKLRLPEAKADTQTKKTAKETAKEVAKETLPKVSQGQREAFIKENQHLGEMIKLMGTNPTKAQKADKEYLAKELKDLNEAQIRKYAAERGVAELNGSNLTSLRASAISEIQKKRNDYEPVGVSRKTFEPLYDKMFDGDITPKKYAEQLADALYGKVSPKTTKAKAEPKEEKKETKKGTSKKETKQEEPKKELPKLAPEPTVARKPRSITELLGKPPEVPTVKAVESPVNVPPKVSENEIKAIQAKIKKADADVAKAREEEAKAKANVVSQSKAQAAQTQAANTQSKAVQAQTKAVQTQTKAVEQVAKTPTPAPVSQPTNPPNFNPLVEALKNNTEAVQANTAQLKATPKAQNNTKPIEQKAEQKTKTEPKAKTESKKKQSKEDTVIDKQKALTRQMQEAYSKDNSVIKTKRWQDQTNQLLGYNKQIADMCIKLGQANKAFGALDQAMQMTHGTPLFDVFAKGWSDLSKRMGKVKDIQKQLTDEATGKSIERQLGKVNREWDNFERQQKKQQAKEEKAAWREHEKRETPVSSTQANRQATKEANTYYKEQEAIEKSIARHNRKLAEQEAKRLRVLNQICEAYAKIDDKIRSHSGANGLQMSQRTYDSTLRAIQALSRRVHEELGHDMSGTLNEGLLKNVNLKSQATGQTNVPTPQVEDLRSRISRLTGEAEKAYQQFAKTKSLTDKIRLHSVISDLHRAQSEERKFNKEMEQTERTLVRIKNLLSTRASWVMSGLGASMLWNLPGDIASEYINLERAMASVQQVLPLIEGNAKETNAEFERLVNIGHEYAQSVGDVVEAATLWGRGYGKAVVSPLDDEMTKYAKELEAVHTTNELVRQSAMLATVDNFDMAESVRGLEAVLAAYDMRAKSAAEATLFAGRAVDIITKVSHTGQISARELVAGLEATGKAAQQAGVSLSFLTALIETGVRNTGMSGSNIGNALKSFMVSIQSDKAAEELQKFGISITKIGADGKERMRPVQDVILDIASALKTGDQNAKNLLFRLSGGKMQFSKISAILKDEGEIIRMWGEASNSAGFAQKQLEIQMNTISAKLQRLRDDLVQLGQDFVQSGAGEMFKNLIDNLDGVIKKVHEYRSVLGTIAMTGIALLGIRQLWKLGQAYAEIKAHVLAYAAAEGVSNKAVATGTVIKQAAMNAIGMKTAAQQRELATELMSNAEKARGTAVEAANTAGTMANATAKGANATAEAVNTAETATNTTAKGANTIAEGANATATSVDTTQKNINTVASFRNAAATAMATGGLSVLTGLIATGIMYMAMSTDETEKNTKSINEHTQATKDNIDQVSDRTSELAQEAQAEEDFADWLEKAGEMYERHTKAIEENGEATEKGQKLRKEQEEMFDRIVAGLGREEAELIKDKGINQEVMSSIAQAHRSSAETRRNEINALRAKEVEYYEGFIERSDGELATLQKSLDGFYDWTLGQIEGLDLLDQAYASFFKGLAGWYDWWGEIHSSWATNLHELADLTSSVSPETSQFFEKAAKYYEDTAKENINYRDKARDKSKSYVQEAIDKLAAERATAYGKLADLRKGITDDRIYSDEGYDTGELSDDDGNGKGSGNGSHGSKETVSFDSEAMKYLEAIAENTELDTPTLWSLAGYRTGGGNPWDMSESNPLGTTQQMIDEFLEGGSLDNLADTTFAFAQAMKAIQSEQPNLDKETLLEILKERYFPDISPKDVVNEAKYLEETYDFSNKRLPRIGNSSGGRNAIIAAVKSHPQGEQWMGDITDNPNIQCDSYTAAVYNMAGANISGVLNDVAFEAAGGYHPIGDGYTPKEGDLVVWGHHVGIYMGDDMVNSRQSTAGVQTISMAQAREWFGEVEGYGDASTFISDLSNPWKNMLGNSDKSIFSWKGNKNRGMAKMLEDYEETENRIA